MRFHVLYCAPNGAARMMCVVHAANSDSLRSHLAECFDVVDDRPGRLTLYGGGYLSYGSPRLHIDGDTDPDTIAR
jgi:hypothetical protein